MRWTGLWIWMLVLGGSACNGDDTAQGAAAPEEETGATPSEDEPPAEPPPDPDDEIAVEMHRRGQEFAEGMTPATPLFRATLDQGERRDYQAVLQGARCFKIIAVGGGGVTDLDLFLFDPDGVQVQQDTATDAYPVLGLTNPICPHISGAYRVQVKMFEGTGDVGVRVFQSEMH